jgi:uncharacterized protein YdhG (YjbR/CyaY superfamily)
MPTPPPSSVDEYIGGFPQSTQEILAKIRSTIHEQIPEASERISYAIPAFALNGKTLVYFAGWKGHVSLYPLPWGDEELQAEMAPYMGGKGTLKFPLAQPIPYALIAKIVQFHKKENEDG